MQRDVTAARAVQLRMQARKVERRALSECARERNVAPSGEVIKARLLLLVNSERDDLHRFAHPRHAYIRTTPSYIRQAVQRGHVGFASGRNLLERDSSRARR